MHAKVKIVHMLLFQLLMRVLPHHRPTVTSWRLCCPAERRLYPTGCLVLIGKTEGITVTELDETDMLLEEMHPNPVTNGTCM